MFDFYTAFISAMIYQDLTIYIIKTNITRTGMKKALLDNWNEGLHT